VDGEYAAVVPVTHEVRQVTEEEWTLLRDVRLRALADSPAAFGSTLAQEQTFTEQRWRERARGAETTRLFLAWTDGRPVGIAGVVDEGDGSVQVVSVWVDPAHRGRGVARSLTEVSLRFAAARNPAAVRLWVTDGNDVARALYESFGFAPTGTRQALPSDPRLEELEMELRPARAR
jgi:ribosomal protein S18 acetylase RimI-like enzyme